MTKLNYHNAYPRPDQWESPACEVCGGVSTTTIIENAKDTDLNMVRCVNCGLMFVSPRPTFEALMAQGYGHDQAAVDHARHYHANSSFFDVKDPAEQRKYVLGYYESLFQRAQKVLQKPVSTVFEVGGLTGLFLAMASLHGIKCSGCELNVEGARIQREQGFDVAAGNFFTYDSQGKQYDLVVALDYIEHSWHPRADLLKLYSMTAPGGGLLIKTFIEELDVGGTMLAPPTHAYHFLGHNLYRILTDCGFVVKSWEIDFGCQPSVVCVRRD